MKRNKWTFGIGTIGRDMLYSLVSMYLIFYMTDVIKMPTDIFAMVSVFVVAARIFDAVNDPFMGLIVDNTKSRFGKFKPWIAVGALSTGVITILIFADFGLPWQQYAIFFGVLFILWDVTFTANDIAYWSMLPALSLDQKEREKIGAIARIFANIGLFVVVAGIVPVTTMLGNAFGSLRQGYFVFTVIIVIIMWGGQLVTLLGVKELQMVGAQKSTPIREMFSVIIKNDQLLFAALSMTLFMIGYMTTTSFGLYFFKYAYGDEGMYSIFAVVLGVSQITALAIFPLFSKKWNRRTLFTLAVILVVIGYIVFFFAPVSTMVFIGIAGVLIFIGQAFIQLMMLMFLTDSVDYGHLKLGKRNDSISLSLQPFINKLGGAVANGVVAAVIIVSGIKDAETAAEVTDGGLLMMKMAMLVFPLICIVCSFLLYRRKYIIDEKKHAEILAGLEALGELELDR